METQMNIEQLGLIPVPNFGIISPSHKLLRSAQPQYLFQYQWLKNVPKVERIINLRAEKDIDSKFAEKLGIENHTILVPDHKTPTLEQVEEFQKLLNDNTLTTLIHCAHGHGRTSTFSVLAKLSIGMTLEEAIADEEKRFHYHFKYPAQIGFLKEFYEQYVLPNK